MFKTIKNRKIRIAVVGCGRISANHFASIDQHAEHFEVVAVCDIDPVASKLWADKYKVLAFASFEELLKQVELDVVSLCTPSGLHSSHAILAAKYGVNVVTEKPMATKWEDGLAMLRACDKAQVKLFVVKQNRRNTTLQMLKRAIDEGRFGKLYMVHVNVFWTRPQGYYDMAPWRGTWALDGGAFMNQASHYVDLLQWLIGPVDSVHAMTSTLARKIEAEDTGVLNLRWKNGALGSMNVTMLTYPKNLEGSITVLGEKGSARVGGVAVNEIQVWSFADNRNYDEAVQNTNYETTSVYGIGHPLYYKNVADVFREVTTPETDGRSGLQSLELLIAAYRSAESGETVHLPLKT